MHFIPRTRRPGWTFQSDVATAEIFTARNETTSVELPLSSFSVFLAFFLRCGFARASNGHRIFRMKFQFPGLAGESGRSKRWRFRDWCGLFFPVWRRSLSTRQNVLGTWVFWYRRVCNFDTLTSVFLEFKYYPYYGTLRIKIFSWWISLEFRYFDTGISGI